MSFAMSKQESIKASEFITTQIEKNDCRGGAIGGRFSYIFTPTTIGLAVEIRDNILKETKNITDFENW